jgi:hypothetical protein
MPLTFDDDECYCLLLAMNAYLEDYTPATHGELAHMENCQAVEYRLMELYDAGRREHGHRELYTEKRRRYADLPKPQQG